MKSIIQDKKECYICGTTENLHEHHIIHGTANRKLSEKYGLKVYLCAYHHNMSGDSVHANPRLDNEMKKLAQYYFEQEHTREDFRQIFGKSYL